MTSRITRLGLGGYPVAVLIPFVQPHRIRRLINLIGAEPRTDLIGAKPDLALIGSRIVTQLVAARPSTSITAAKPSLTLTGSDT